MTAPEIETSITHRKGHLGKAQSLPRQNFESPRPERERCATFVGMDLHRRRSVLVRMTETGEHLETVRIVNTRDRLAEVMTRAGESPEVVLEATYGWYWAVDALAELGASVHLAHPLGVKAFSYRRVKNDQRDAADLADLLRMGRLPHAWSRHRKPGSCESWCGTGPERR